MKLSDYLKKNNLTQRDFLLKAKEDHGATFSRFALVKWCNGSRIPRPEDMRLINLATDGIVRPDDFYLTETLQ